MWEVAPAHAAGVTGGVLALAAWLAAGAVVKVLAWLRVPPVRRFLARYRAAPGMVRAAALLMAISAGIHLGLAFGHRGVQPITSLLFVVNAVAFTWLAAQAFSGRPWWRRASATLLGLTIAAYLVFVVAGVEGPDQVGIATKLLETAALGLVLVPSRAEGPAPRHVLRWAGAAIGVPAVTLVVGVTVWAVDLARPDARHSHPGAVLQAANRIPTGEQLAAADSLRDETRRSIARSQDWHEAAAAGYRVQGPADERVQHWTNETYASSGDVLNPQRPAGLVYVNTGRGLVLAGAMYHMPRLGEFGPDPGGPLTVWHAHQHICFSMLGWGIGLETPFSNCPLGAVSVSAPAMLHVWTVDNPRGGQFAVDLDPQVVDRLAHA